LGHKQKKKKITSTHCTPSIPWVGGRISADVICGKNMRMGRSKREKIEEVGVMTKIKG
jgi:hypothetical protein